MGLITSGDVAVAIDIGAVIEFDNRAGDRHITENKTAAGAPIRACN